MLEIFCQFYSLVYKIRGTLKKHFLTRYSGGRMCKIFNARRSSAVTDQSDSLRISTKLDNILLNPLKDSHLVHDSVVGHLPSS